MFVFISLTMTGGAFMYSLYSLEVHKILYNNLMPVLRYPQRCYNFFLILRLCVLLTYLKICQKLNNTVKRVGKEYLISYVIGGKLFMLKVPEVLDKVLMIIDQDNEDVTDLILPHMGPLGNWHGVKYSPCSFDKDMLTFEMVDGDTKVYHRHDLMI